MGELPQWIVLPSWNKFQHYSDRGPVWIKLYLELNSSDDWLELTRAERGLLTTIWVEYARARGCLRAKTVLSLCDAGARYAHIEALSDAGFLKLSASKPAELPLALTRSREKRREEKKEGSPSAKKPKPVDKPEAKPVNMPPADGARYIKKLIKNGTITDQADLDAELAHYHLAKNLEAELRSLVQLDERDRHGPDMTL